MNTVFVFNGEGGHFPGGIFTTRELAEEWIGRHHLSGVLTRYPLDVPVYEWAISSGVFTPTRPEQSGATFIQRFSSASQEHHHYKDGGRVV
jgi:hypothetical protein